MGRIPPEPGSLAQRLLWLAAIWLGSVLVLGLVAWVLRAWLKVG